MNTHKLVQAHLQKRSLVSLFFYPLGTLYAFGQAFRRRHMYKNPYHAPCKIISIGNIVSGGSGKTPLTIALARLLCENGYRVGVSHRGYKGEFENSPHLISDSTGLLFPVQSTGDEAHLIAASLPGIPVVAGRKRSVAIALLMKAYPATQVIILDDAFQHIQVFRDVDILSFAAETGLGNGFVLPAGYLRESLSALCNKNLAVIYRKGIKQRSLPWEADLEKRVECVIHSYSTATDCIDPQGFRHPVLSLIGKRLVLVSGIAHPSSFESTVKELGLDFSRHFAYPDHYAFENLTEHESWLNEIPDIILCTQKDLMKLSRNPELSSRLRALVLDYHFDQPEKLKELLISKLA